VRKPNMELPAGWGELGLLRQLRERAGKAGRGELRLGIGDDCALIRLRAHEELAVTTDLSIAGRHFRLDWHPPEAIGYRALARGLSDLAAMGARPVAAFLSLGLPRELTQARSRAITTSWMSLFLDGLLRLAREHHTPLAGGDLAESPLALADIVLIGAVGKNRALLRSGAAPGDVLYVTGALGGAAAGLELLEKLAAKRGFRPEKLRAARIAAGMAAHLEPQPRIAQGLWLARRGAATAAIDLSDGLSTDLNHICEESGVGAEIEEALLPIHAGASLKQALNGGEDYELLFAARPTARIPREIEGVAVTRIGRVVKRRKSEPAAVMLSERGAEPLEARGWEHFS
jgi:thiamine-monophosphate kinase